MITLAPGTKVTSAEAVKRLVKDKRRWEVRSAEKGSKGERWYAWTWIATASPRHHLLVRRHLKTGELAFHYCYVPEGQLLTKTRLIRAAGLNGRWKKNSRSARTASGWTSARQALRRDPAPHRPGHGRPGGLRRHRRQVRDRTEPRPRHPSPRTRRRRGNRARSR